MPEPQHVLIADDSARMVGLLERWLKRAGFQVMGVTTIQEALEVLATQATDWVITDLMRPTGDGMDILAHVRVHQPQAKVIVMTAFGVLCSARCNNAGEIPSLPDKWGKNARRSLPSAMLLPGKRRV